MCQHSHNDAFHLETVHLDIIKTRIRREFSKEALRDMRASTTLNVEQEIADILVLELVAFMTGKVVNRIHVDVEYPATWWDAFKERWFFQWMLNRWPAKYKRVYINENQFAICPHLATEQREVHYEWLRTADDHKEEIFCSKTT